VKVIRGRKEILKNLVCWPPLAQESTIEIIWQESKMAVTAEKTFAVEGIRVPDSSLAREITQLVRDTESALFSTIRVGSIIGARSPESVAG
jgi:hypothetical protein